MAAGRVCGGTSMCGRDALCGPQCCAEGHYCRRQSSSLWSCVVLTGFTGGRLGA